MNTFSQPFYTISSKLYAVVLHGDTYWTEPSCTHMLVSVQEWLRRANSCKGVSIHNAGDVFQNVSSGASTLLPPGVAVPTGRAPTQLSGPPCRGDRAEDARWKRCVNAGCCPPGQVHPRQPEANPDGPLSREQGDEGRGCPRAVTSGGGGPHARVPEGHAGQWPGRHRAPPGLSSTGAGSEDSAGSTYPPLAPGLRGPWRPPSAGPLAPPGASLPTSPPTPSRSARKGSAAPGRRVQGVT